jgi:hypothetical protein
MRQEHGEAIGQAKRMAKEMKETNEEHWRDELLALLRKHRRKESELAGSAKSAEWKVELAATLKTRTTATNRWLGQALRMGNLYTVSRLVSAWRTKAHP